MRYVNDSVVERVRQHYDTGARSAEMIALKTDLDVMTVERALTLLASEAKPAQVSNVDILNRNLKLLQDLLETAQWEYRACPDVDNATSVTAMVAASIHTIKEIEARKDPAALLNETLARAIQPLFREFIKFAALASSRARDDLFDAVPQAYHARVDVTLKELIKTLGRDVSVGYKRTVEALADVLGCKAEDGNVQPFLHAVRASEVSDGNEKETDSDSALAATGEAPRPRQTAD